MAEFVDLHCHWVPGIDDGARSLEEGQAMLRALGALGFVHVVATPHMRPGLFDNQRADLVRRFNEVLPTITADSGLPEVSLASEHFFDPQVLEELRRGEALPYLVTDTPGSPRRGGALLIEFQDLPPPRVVERQLYELQLLGYIPVIAHPERYRSLWTEPTQLGRLVELGSVALLDVAAVVGKYGSETQRSAQRLLELGYYDAACSDAHRPADVDQVADGLHWLGEHYGPEELQFMMETAPRALLGGSRPA